MTGSDATDDAELASVGATLEDLYRRVGAMAQRRERESNPREDLVAALYETERSLLAAVRSVAKARRRVG